MPIKNCQRAELSVTSIIKNICRSLPVVEQIRLPHSAPDSANKAEENGNTTYGAYEWSFGNGGENNRHYGWPSPSSGRILCGAISSTAGSQAPAEMKVMVIVNGNEAGNDYIITKPIGLFSQHFTFNTPFELNAGDRINLRSKTSNASVTHSVVSLISELDL